MPFWSNFHTHTPLCDGTGTIDEYVAAAAGQNVTALGFSSHAPLAFEPDWTLAEHDLAAYCAQVRAAGRPDGPAVYCGLEIDYVPGITWPGHGRFSGLDLDYTIGAVHVGGFIRDGYAWSIDAKPENFREGIDAVCGGSARAAVERYYALVREMVGTHPPDIVAHLDVVKKNNAVLGLFREDDTWYRRAVADTLDAVAASGCMLEVNTGGIARGRSDTYFPSPWIIELALARSIPLVLSSDTHVPAQVTAGFTQAAQDLKALGCNELFSFDGRQWRPFGFDENGLID